MRQAPKRVFWGEELPVRQAPRRVFWGEEIPVRLTLRNRGWLPVVWLRLQETTPAALGAPQAFSLITRLDPKGEATFSYTLHALRRGYYPIGPLRLTSGDLFGLTNDLTRQTTTDDLIVYPRIVPLPRFALPSRSPFGALRSTHPILEDPVRLRGKREYVAGDPLRRIDWKTSAAQGRLHVKLYEPSIALEVVILLDLHTDDYDLRTRLDDSELAVVAAASLANWVSQQKQALGLLCNGLDPLHGTTHHALPARQGRQRLLHCLDLLARVQLTASRPAPLLLREALARLPWGATLMLISGRIEEPLLAAGLQAPRYGVNLVFVACDKTGPSAGIRRRAAQLGFKLIWLRNEKDLEELR